MESIKLNRIFYFIAIFLVCFLVFVLRRPEIITNAQFWAEDGTVWYSQANMMGPLQSLILPRQGYYQSISKLVASMSLLIPIYYAPLFYNIISISLRCFVVMFLLSKRLNMYSLPSRFMIAAFVLLMPHLEEVHANITNAQWYLSMLLFMVLIANKPESIYGNIHDVAVLIVAGLSGPFIVFMAPLLALKLISKAPGDTIVRKTINAVKEIDWFSILFVVVVLIQTMSILLSYDDTRVHTELGATLQLLINIFSSRVFAGFALSDSSVYALWHMNSLNNIIAAISIPIILFTLYRANWRTWAIVIYPFVMVSFALARPMISTEIPQWHGLEYPGTGQRYFLITGIFWFAILLLAASKSIKPVKIAAYAALIAVIIKVAIFDFHMLPLPDANWSSQVEKYHNAKTGDVVTMSINPPGWTMEVVK